MNIPKRILIDSGTLLRPTGKDLGTITGTTYQLSRIRVETDSKYKYGTVGDLEASKGTMFFDAKNSKGEVPQKGDLFTDARDAQQYTIREVKPEKQSNRIHHYECVLS